MDERKTSRQEIIDGSGTHSLRSTSTASSAPIPKTNIHTSQLSVSASTMAPTSNHILISNELYPSSSLVKPFTPIPDIYEWTHSANPIEQGDFLCWARSTGEQMADPDECERLLKWAFSSVDIADVATPDVSWAFYQWAHSISTMAAPEESKRRYLKWPHCTSTMAAPNECERWGLQEEISKPFETAMKRLQEEVTQVLRDIHLEDEDGDLYEHVYPDIIQDYMIYTCQKGMHGVYQCQNALWIWPNIRTLPLISCPRDVGKKIIEKFPESDVIKGRPSVNDVGYVTIELSGKWIAKSIHKMQKDGIDTWAPKLPLERVIVDYSSLADEMHEDSYRQLAIGNTLKNILVYSKVEVTISHPRSMTTHSKRDWAQTVSGFRSEEDLLALRYGRADWIVYVTPVWEQEYLEKCFSNGKVKERVTSNRHKYARTSCAGYRSCTTEGYRSCATELEEYMVSKAKTLVVENQDQDAMLLGYTAKDVLVCDFRYLYLKTHRLAECKFNLNDEMLKEEGNTFLHLLRTKANIRRLNDRCRKYVNGIKDASELKLGEYEGWEEGEERMLGIKLLEFTEALKESCLSVLPHILCEYLYDLSNKFNSYYSHKYAPNMERNQSIHSTLLLSETTAVVMEKCFHLLGITPTPSFPEESKILPPLSSLYYPRERLMDVDAWNLPRNSRFELFSFNTYIVKYRGDIDDGTKLFGCISVSDKCGLVSAVGESHFFEPDFAHVSLFNHNWCNPIKIADSRPVYVGNPSSRHSVPLSSSVEIGMELYVIRNKNECYQLCNHKVEIDLSDFWDNKKADSACGRLTFFSVDNGSTILYYILLKDAVDAALEVKFETKTRERKVRGYVLAYYGNDFLNECQCEPKYKYDYMALLFKPKDEVLEAGEIQLIKSVLAVPTKGSLVIIAYLEDVKSGKVIMDNSCRFKSKFSSCSIGTMSGVEGEDCYLDLKVDWKYQA